MSSWYEVRADDRVITCRPRGRFKLESQEVLCGDRVRVQLVPDGTGYITEVLPRTNSLVRPPVANIDRVLVVFTLKDPAVDPGLVDRVAIHAALTRAQAALVLNKIDLVTPEEVSEMQATYLPTGLPFFAVSALTGFGIGALREHIAGGTSVLAGQSGVGKSRLLNALAPGALRKTGDVSDKIRRGRHTTRHVELIPVLGSGFLVDTPGFSLLEPPPVGKWELSSLFPEIMALESECRFTDCLHRDEPGCAVKLALSESRIPKTRYENYITLLGEIEQIERNKY